MLLCFAFACSMLCLSICIATPAEILSGWGRILSSRAVLFSDYFLIGGLGAAFTNAAVVLLMSIGLVKLCGARFSGNLLAALFLMPGFALFGKNPLNVLPFFLGVALYCKNRRIPFRKHIGAALYSTTLCPIVSELLFVSALPLPLRIALSLFSGVFIGFIIVPFAEHMLSVHCGYILFNYGFACGFLAYLIMALYRAGGFTVQTASDWMPLRPAAVLFFLLSLCVLLVFLGLWFSGWRFQELLRVLKVSGCAPNNDLFSSVGIGPAMVNMGCIGLLSVAYILLIGGDFSGPVVGAIFTAIGFAASGVHPKNFFPVLLGVWLFARFGAYPVTAPNVQLAAIFGAVALAPVAGEYGFFAGLAAGLFHYALVSVTGTNTGGLNLYNNGFAAGIVATIMVTLLDTFVPPRSSSFLSFIRAQRHIEKEEDSVYEDF